MAIRIGRVFLRSYQPLAVCRISSGWKTLSSAPLTRTLIGALSSPFSTLSSLPHCQTVTSDGKTIVCVHPPKETPLEETRPLRPMKPGLRESLTREEVATVRKLRREDPSLWTVNTLARLFNAKKGVISKVAPASPKYQEELDRERELQAAMRPYRKKIYRAQQQAVRQKRLQEILAQRKYNFPGQSDKAPS